MKAISELLSYVLLILISLSLALTVYSFLQYKARIPEKVECPQGVSVYVVNYTCNNEIEFYLKNSGFWNISGINIKVYGELNNLCNFTETSENLAPGEVKNFSIGCNNPKKLEILPFINSTKNKKIYCSNAIIRLDIC
ncbi:MAG: hypothetical protein QXO12_01365 [Candidatus Pacearchaeota archaeon]